MKLKPFRMFQEEKMLKRTLKICPLQYRSHIHVYVEELMVIIYLSDVTHMNFITRFLEM
jgi:hypothetical protein